MESVINHRRNLHKIPELDRDLPETTAYVENVLKALSCKVFSPTKGSVCAYFDLQKEETVAFRADMDALPVEEQGSAPYRSCHPGKMHACGHDGHTAMVLALAEYVEAHKDALPRNVLLIFQPAEETTGGAKELCDTGLLEQYRVKKIFGIHLWPGLPQGTAWTRPGPQMAKNSEVNVRITGRSAHITRSHQGVDALWIGTEALRRIYHLRDTALPPEELRVLGFGKMTSGTVRNAVSSETELLGSLRVFSQEAFDVLTEGTRKILKELEAAYGCTASVSFSEGYAPVYNDPALAEALLQQLPEVQRLPAPDLTAEDFSFYQQHVPGVFFFLGVGDAPALHAANFDFDETALLKGVALYEKLLRL